MWIGGQPGDSIDATDRGLNYGDGLFETVAVVQGQPKLWQAHMERLQSGCDRLNIPFPGADLLMGEMEKAVPDRGNGVLKIVVTRGPGGRGYRPPETLHPTRIVAFHPAPTYPAACWTEGVTTRICETRLGRNPSLAGMKHLNRLEQVLARQEWCDDSIAEGIMFDTEGRLVSGTMSNIFLVSGGRLTTPSLSRCGVEGVMRRQVLDIATHLGMAVEIRDIPADRLGQADAVFLTNALMGIWPVRQIDNQVFSPDAVPAALREHITQHALPRPT